MTAVVEGDVVDPRRIERNAVRTPAILPPSKDEKLRALSRMDPQQQVEHVTEMLVHSHAGLLVAIAAQDLPGIVEAKQKAATIQEIVKQKRMGKEMQDHAAEFCLRVERGLGVAIREGQERGEILKRREPARRSNQHSHDSGVEGQPVYTKSRPTDFAKADELSSKRGGIYAMTDGVSDAQFNEAVAEAKAEGNLSRANVARKCQAKAQESKPLLDENDPEIDADVQAQPPKSEPAQPKKRLTKHTSTEMLANIDGMLHGIVESIPFIDPTDIDADVNAETIRSIHTSMSGIRKLLKEITNG